MIEKKGPPLLFYQVTPYIITYVRRGCERTITFSKINKIYIILRIGISEKGLLSLELTVDSDDASQSSYNILSNAVSKLEEYKAPSMFGKGPERYTFQYLLPVVSYTFIHTLHNHLIKVFISFQMSLDMRVLFSNSWLFSSIISSKMEKNQLMNSMIRTTTFISQSTGDLKVYIYAYYNSCLQFLTQYTYKYIIFIYRTI
jgi:hypothetical protein